MSSDQVKYHVRTPIPLWDHIFVELSLPNYIVPAPRCTRRNSTKFIQPRTSIDSGKFSFFPYSITQWNKLPDHVVNTTSLDNFKSLFEIAFVTI